ncbi:MAG: addiction module antidote protein [Planktotalea arctica]|uniref:addiction module antidote protein n=1 Tax=Planktotalea arctica TaxID=1481893 RepID=UPI003219C680
MALETRTWDPVERLSSPEAQDAYLEAAFEDGDPDLIVAAIGDIARARGMTEIAASANVSREVMYKSFRQGGNPTLSTLSQVARALGYKLTFQHTAQQ